MCVGARMSLCLTGGGNEAGKGEKAGLGLKFLVMVGS